MNSTIYYFTFTDLFNSYSLADHINAQLDDDKNWNKESKIKPDEIQKYFPHNEIVLKEQIKNPDLYKLSAYDIIDYLKFSSYAYMSYQLGIKESIYDEEEALKEALEPLELNYLQNSQIKKAFDNCQDRRTDQVIKRGTGQVIILAAARWKMLVARDG